MQVRVASRDPCGRRTPRAYCTSYLRFALLTRSGATWDYTITPSSVSARSSSEYPYYLELPIGCPVGALAGSNSLTPVENC